jgi:hypothetical protein
VAHRILGQGDRRRLGHAQPLADPASQPRRALALDLGRTRRGADEHEAQRREVVAVDGGMTSQGVGDRRHHGGHGDPMVLDHAQEGVELEARERHHARARAQRRVEHHTAEHVREGDDPRDDVVGPEPPGRRRGVLAQRCHRAGMRVHGALGQAAGPTRAQQERDRVGIGVVGPDRLGGGQRSQREQRLGPRPCATCSSRR